MVVCLWKGPRSTYINLCQCKFEGDKTKKHSIVEARGAVEGNLKPRVGRSSTLHDAFEGVYYFLECVAHFFGSRRCLPDWHGAGARGPPGGQHPGQCQAGVAKARAKEPKQTHENPFLKGFSF